MALINLIVKPYSNPVYGCKQFGVYNEKEYSSWDGYDKNELHPVAVFFTEEDAKTYVKLVNGSSERLNQIKQYQIQQEKADKREAIKNYIKRESWKMH